MTKLPSPPLKTPVVDSKGIMSREWVLYFNKVNQIFKELQDAVEELQGGS